MRISDWSSDVCSSDLTQRVTFKTADGAIALVYVNKQDVWIDVSRLQGGERGSAVYAAAADYAFNTQHRFIGDPAEIGRASCRERVCQYVVISVVAVSLQKKKLT